MKQFEKKTVWNSWEANSELKRQEFSISEDISQIDIQWTDMIKEIDIEDTMDMRTLFENDHENTTTIDMDIWNNPQDDIIPVATIHLIHDILDIWISFETILHHRPISHMIHIIPIIEIHTCPENHILQVDMNTIGLQNRCFLVY